MLRLQVPYHKVLVQPADLDIEEFDSLLRHYLRASCTHPVIVEVFNMSAQFFLFMRGGQIYWVTVDRGKGFHGIPIRLFFSELKKLQFPQIIVYQVDLVLYHSLLVYLQKKPELKVNSTLVDLDELLDRMEKSDKSALLSAHQPGNLLMIRYHEGKPIACYHGPSETRAGTADIREVFLVKVYTLSAHSHFDINLFTDLIPAQAEDARPLPDEYDGTISSFYLGQPPVLVVKLKSRPLKTYPFTGKEMSIGRNIENDIVIDNLSVSRRHAVVTSAKDGFYITDCDSKNGTFLNGKPVKRERLTSGDTILLGKYVIVFEVPQGEGIVVGDLDQTVIIPNFRAPKKETELHIDYPVASDANPRLCCTSTQEVYPIKGESFCIGKDKCSDIRVKGFFTPKRLVEIRREGKEFVLQKIASQKKVIVNGEVLDEKILEENDLITIGAEEYVFKR
jgi:pSer/pThr/pTyr-binding forkhead associated (FHA) protein